MNPKVSSLFAKSHSPKPVDDSTVRENTVAVLLLFHDIINPGFEFVVHVSPPVYFWNRPYNAFWVLCLN